MIDLIRKHAALAIAAIALSASAEAGFVQYGDKAAWLAAAGAPTTIDFVLPESAVLTDQYEYLGVSFPQGNDVAYPSTGFLDGRLGRTGQPVHLRRHDRPVGPAAVRDRVRLRGLPDLSSTMETRSCLPRWLLAAWCQFGGIVSTVPFDRVRIWDPSDNGFALDNIHFVAIPGPA